MKRIDSINARQDINGTGKAGFHDNADLSGQDATYLTPDWLNHIQEELCNLLEKNGRPLNSGQLDQLWQLLATDDDINALAAATQQKLDQEQTGRTDADNWLSGRITAIDNFLNSIVDLFYPVGIIVAFGIPNFNPNDKWTGTTWVRHGEGRASVGVSTQIADPNWTKAVGNTFGEYDHQLTEAELAKCKPSIRLAHESGGTMDTSGFPNTNASRWETHSGSQPDLSECLDDGTGNPLGSIGNDQPHNNVQPSIVDARWRRVA